MSGTKPVIVVSFFREDKKLKATLKMPQSLAKELAEMEHPEAELDVYDEPKYLVAKTPNQNRKPDRYIA
jgi:hypothetical protein